MSCQCPACLEERENERYSPAMMATIWGGVIVFALVSWLAVFRLIGWI